MLFRSGYVRHPEGLWDKPASSGVYTQPLHTYYILLINIRDKNKRTILGNMYLDNTYKINTITAKANITSFI